MRTTLLSLCCLTISSALSAQSKIDSIQTLSEIIVLGNSPRADNLLLPQTGVIGFASEEIARQPSLFGEPDILRTIQSQAGISGGTEGFSGLFVRGGENDENLFLLHHLPVIHKGHLGGLFSSFNVAAVDQVRFFKAEFPAQYGGRISSVSNILLKEGNYQRYHGQISVGLLSGSVYVSGPVVKDRLALSAGVRRSWTELMIVPLLAIINHGKKEEGKKEALGYALTDVNLKLDFRLNPQVGGFAHYYRGSDRFKLGEEEFMYSGESRYEENSTLRLRWSSEGVVGGIHYAPSPDLFLFAKGYYTRFASTLTQNNDEVAQDDTQYIHKTDENGISETGLSLRSEATLAEWLVSKAGADYLHHRYKPEHLEIASSMERQGLLSIQEAQIVRADEVNLWTDHQLSLSERLQLSLGLRFTGYFSEGITHCQLEPRTCLRLSLSDKISVKASYGRTSQFVQQIEDSYVSLPTGAWVPTGSRWKPLKGDQVTAGVYGDLPLDSYFSVEVYYKWMKNLLEYKEGAGSVSAAASINDKLASGNGWAYGADISIHRDKGRLTGTIGYGLLWSWRQFDELNKGRAFPAKYDNRHKLNISATYHLRKHLELNAAWTYMTGNRVTLALHNYKKLDNAGFTDNLAPLAVGGYKWGIGYYPSRNNVRLPAYHRLDAGISWYRPYPKGRMGIWNFSLYNLYSRMNPIAIRKDGVETSFGGGDFWTTSFQTVGLLPVVPSVSYTYKF